MKPVNVGLVGVGGYAKSYLNSLQKLELEGLVKLSSVVIRSAGKYPEEEKSLSEKGVPIRRSLDEMLDKDVERLDLAAIPTAIHYHREQMIQSVNAGLDVVLEKPSAATIQDMDEMLAALDRTGRFCVVGFQNQWNPTVLELKRAVCAGRLGRIEDITVVCNWQRDDDYYIRNSWAGAISMGGRYILDGTINNPMAHYLFIALYLASREWGQAGTPVSVRAELYRAHKIASEDTSCLEISCRNGTSVYFYGSLCAREQYTPPTIELKGERGRAVWTLGQPARILKEDRVVEEISNSAMDIHAEVFRNAARYLRGLDTELMCPLAMTRSHVLAVNGAFESAGVPVQIPENFLKMSTDPKSGSVITQIVPDVDALSREAAEKRLLYGDLDVPWAVKSEPFSLQGYAQFEMKPKI